VVLSLKDKAPPEAVTFFNPAFPNGAGLLTRPPGPLARPDRGRAHPTAGQRMPDIHVHASGRAATLHSILRDGRHVLVVPAAEAAGVLSDPRATGAPIRKPPRRLSAPGAVLRCDTGARLLLPAACRR
jgi:hypothetical protein